MEVVLSAEQWDQDPPECPECARRARGEPAPQMHQEFKPPAITGSHRARAVRLAEDIASNDYGVANMSIAGRQGERNKVRYKDQSDGVRPAAWTGPNAREYQMSKDVLEAAVKLGRANRLQHGTGLDTIKQMPDLIANSKRISHKIW
ncbi:MAG TPA: hypothetical protein VHT52_22100 [Stellaceae bacterium]|jgi:hypothetical protein|nr:hypothetical protein [Stellaceae bacterium]